MRNIDLTKEIVEKFAKYMLCLHDLTPIEKKKSKFMVFIAWFLDFFGIILKEDFMKHYTTTIANKVYLSFSIGSNEKSFTSQVMTISHECQHAIQQLADKLLFYIGYLFSSKLRVEYEIEAYITGMEMYYYLVGNLDSFKKDLDRLINKLKNYLCDSHLDYAREMYLEAIERIENGESITLSAERAKAFLKNVDLK